MSYRTAQLVFRGTYGPCQWDRKGGACALADPQDYMEALRHQPVLSTEPISVRDRINPWFALHVRSNFEKATSTILEAKGLHVYYPSFRQKKRWSDRIREIEKPLFPGYVFCRFDPECRLPVLKTQGVVGMVGVAGVPTPIADSEIEAVQRIVQSGLAARPWPFQNVGQHVLIETGPLAGTEGIILECKNIYRIVVSINLLQRSVVAEIDAEMARAVRPLPCSRRSASTN
jgi:transcription antitermination factor NusG